MIKLCIFDLDGTVLDTVHTISYYGNAALLKHGVEPIPTEAYKHLVGTGIVNLIKNMLNFRNSYSDALFEAVYKDYDNAYNADVTYKTEIFDGMKETLDKLKQDGKKLAIVSNKPDYATKEVIKTMFGEGYFDYVTGKVDGIPLKPDPTAVLYTLRHFGVNADEAVYLGDTSTDMKTGKAAGLYTIGVLWGFRDENELKSSGADTIAKETNELYGIITCR